MSGKNFRAWDTEAKCYVKDPILVDNFGQVYVVCEEPSGKQGTCLITHKPNVIKEQYTDLKDQNGKEICIGDVVSEHHGDIIGEIVQKPSGEYRIAWIGIYGGESVLYDHHSLCEVIGNIHENPELIEKEK